VRSKKKKEGEKEGSKRLELFETVGKAPQKMGETLKTCQKGFKPGL